MSKIVSLTARRKKQGQAKAQGKTLCGRGFHKWRTDKHKPFDVKQGKLITVRRCERCGLTRTTAD